MQGKEERKEDLSEGIGHSSLKGSPCQFLLMTRLRNTLPFSYDAHLLNLKGMQALATLPYVPMKALQSGIEQGSER